MRCKNLHGIQIDRNHNENLMGIHKNVWKYDFIGNLTKNYPRKWQADYNKNDNYKIRSNKTEIMNFYIFFNKDRLMKRFNEK